MDVGATLRRARTEKRLTLDQLSRATKISLSTLRALENNDFAELPAAVYTRGFLRVYAHEVGLDPDDTVAQFMEQLEEVLAIEMSEERAAAEAAAAAAAAAHAPRARENRHGLPSYPRSAAVTTTPVRIQIDLKSLPKPAIAAAAVFLMVAIIAFALRAGDEAPQLVTAEAAPQEAAQAGVGAPAAGDAARASNVADDVLRIELKTTGPCWVSATADRTPVLARLLQAGESETIAAKDEFVLRVGDPSTISVSLNGVALRPLGRKGVPVTLEINRENFRELLAS
jgi:cytoskeletal protein RodZ